MTTFYKLMTLLNNFIDKFESKKKKMIQWHAK